MAIIKKKNMSEKGMTLPLRAFQNALHTCLYTFLNGGNSTKASKVMYPLIDNVKNDFKDCLKNIVAIRNIEPAFLGEIQELLEKKNGVLSSVEYAQIIATAYKGISETFQREKKTSNSVKEIRTGRSWKEWLNETKKESKKYEFLTKLRTLQGAIQKELGTDLLEVVLHGSFSTLDFCEGWSDVDVLFVIKKAIIEDPKKLLLMRRKMFNLLPYLFYYDPLQHHGFFVLAEHDLDYYPQSYFPFVLFEKGNSLFESRRLLHFRERECLEENRKQFMSFYHYLMGITDKNLRNSYEFKNFLHTLFMLPVAYLQLKGKSYKYKREAIKIVKKNMNQERKDYFEDISNIRVKWGYIPNKILFNICKMLPNPYSYHYAYKYGAIHKNIVKKEEKKAYKEYAKIMAVQLQKDLITSKNLTRD
jgi:predicted nucleotidyltransferase